MSDLAPVKQSSSQLPLFQIGMQSFSRYMNGPKCAGNR
jgi:hypothetical protein